MHSQQGHAHTEHTHTPHMYYMHSYIHINIYTYVQLPLDLSFLSYWNLDIRNPKAVIPLQFLGQIVMHTYKHTHSAGTSQAPTAILLSPKPQLLKIHRHSCTHSWPLETPSLPGLFSCSPAWSDDKPPLTAATAPRTQSCCSPWSDSSHCTHTSVHTCIYTEKRVTDPGNSQKGI